MLATTSAAAAATLFQCTTPSGGVSYAAAPCAGANGAPIAVDRPNAGEGRAETTEVLVGRRPPHRLTADERTRILRLRQAAPEARAEILEPVPLN